MERGFKKAAVQVAKFDAVYSKVVKTSAKTAGFSAMAGAATSLAAAVAPAAGAMVALPAAMALVKTASGVAKVALIGMGDAMSAVAEGDAKQLEEALKKLSPEARKFVLESKGFVTAFDPIRRSVQDKVFEGLHKQIDPVSKNLLPSMKTGMLGVAASFNTGAKEAFKFAASPVAKGTLNAVFKTTKTVMDQAATAVGPLLGGVASLVKLGLPLAQRMAEWAINGIKVAGAFLQSEAGAAKLSGWAKKAGDTLAQLGRIAANLGRFLGGVFESAKGSGDGVLDTIEQLTAKMSAFAKSAGGQERMTEAFQLLLEVLRAVVDVLPVFLGPLGAIATLLTSMSPEVRGVVTQFLAFAVVGTLLAGKLGTMLTVVKGVATASVVAGGSILKFAQGAATGAAGLDKNAGAAAKAGAAFRTMNTAVWSGIQSATAFTASTGKLVLEKGKLVLASAGAAAKQGLHTAAMVAGSVASKALAVATRLVNAAMKANPIGIVITILAALVGAIVLAYNKSETFRKIVDAAWKGIRTAVSFAWNNVLKPAFQALYNFIVNTLAPKMLWFHNNIVAPVFNKVGSVIKTAWNSVIKPVFDFLAKTITKTVPDAFNAGVNAIKRVWDKVKDIARTPVNFVIGLYNDGVAKLVNQLASFVGINTRLPTIPKFAEGGVLPGYSPGKDTMIAAVSPGESIFRPEFTKAVGAGFVNNANAVARSKGPSGVRSWLSGPKGLGGEGLAFARGGIVPGFAGNFAFGGIIGDFIKGVKDFTIGNVAKGARTLLDKVFGAAVPGGGILRQIISAVPKWITDRVVSWVTGKVETGGVGGPKIANATRFAKAQAGKPYVWGGAGPGGYDCSGFMGAIQNVIRGRNPYSRMYSTHSFGPTSGPDGMVRNMRSGFTVGVTDAGVGHMAGTLGNMNVESRGSAGVVVGPAARGTTNGLFTRRYGLKYDTGGILEPGFTPVFNGTGKPEYVFTRDQMEQFGGGGNTYHITATVPLGVSKGEVGREIVEHIKEYERRSGNRWRGTK